GGLLLSALALQVLETRVSEKRLAWARPPDGNVRRELHGRFFRYGFTRGLRSHRRPVFCGLGGGRRDPAAIALLQTRRQVSNGRHGEALPRQPAHGLLLRRDSRRRSRRRGRA